MAPNSANGDDQQNFQHRWTFRMTENDLDSMSNNSSSSRSSEEVPLSLKMPNKQAARVPAHDVVVIDDDEDADDGDRGNSEANIDGGSEIRKKGKRGRKTTTKKESAAAAQNKRVNNADNAFEQLPLNDLKNYMSSMLDEMKETRGGILTCLKKELKKMVADEVALQFEILRKQCSSCSHQLLANQATERTTTKNKRPSDDASNASNLRNEDHNRNKYSMAIVPVASSPDSKQPEIVLGIKADQSASRSKRGKRVAESSNNNQTFQVSEDKSGGRRLGLGLGLGFEFEPGSLSYNLTSPKYSTLPTRVPTRREFDDPPSFNNVQGRVEGSSGGSYNMGYFQRLLQSDESSGSRALMGSYLRENRLASSSSRFQGGVLHQNVADGMNRQFPAGLRISAGGLRFTSGSNSMMNIPNNNFHHGNYRSDHGRSMAFQDGFQFHK